MTPGRFLFLAGAMPFLILGVAHARATPRFPESRRGLAPRDPALIGAMQRSYLRLTSRIDVWSTWVGFNFSHSLGAVVFGIFVLLLGRSDEAFTDSAGLAVPLAVVVAVLYLLIGIKYWFRTPIIGITISLACFGGAWALMLSGR